MNKNYLLTPLLIICTALVLTSCSDEEALNLQSGTLVLKITDAASDDEEIKGIYLTVADVKLDGKPVRNYDPQTIEISNLKNGRTSLLIEKELAAKSYERLTLVLAATKNDQAGTAGCYVVTTSNSKHNLFTDTANPSPMEISALKPFELLPAQENNLVIDFNLRKAIIRNTTGEGGYRFVTQSELENALRVINEENSGTITGEVKANNTENNKIYVLVYRPETFKASVEGTGYGKSKVLFANAVTSTLVGPDGSYNIPFIEEGDYEIKIASFRRNKQDVFVFNGFLHTTSKKTGMLLNNVTVSAGAETELNIEVFTLF